MNYGYLKIHPDLLDIHKSILDIQNSVEYWISLIRFLYPKMYFRISINIFLDVQK